jgi:ppGpp synthetase/RelA/SpoT-type nucleotidyltranferase
MPLPVTKAELNRLGDRLRDSQDPSDADRELLAAVLTAYRQNLGQAESHLLNLGYEPTTRIKTIPTMADKLRRTHGMELARMQDLAGARIVVDDMIAQDEAAEKINVLYQQLGCRCRLIDRRTDPRYGYRAVHLIVHIDQMPLEIQVRTQMQDTWANIVERLADRWGRGIRYGQDPDPPAWPARISDEVATLRRKTVALLMEMSDAIVRVERNKAVTKTAGATLDRMANSVRKLQPTQTMPNDLRVNILEGVAAVLEDLGVVLDPEIQEILVQQQDITYAQAGRLIEVSRTSVDDYIRLADDALHVTGQALTYLLQQIGKAERW